MLWNQQRLHSGPDLARGASSDAAKEGCIQGAPRVAEAFWMQQASGCSKQAVEAAGAVLAESLPFRTRVWQAVDKQRPANLAGALARCEAPPMIQSRCIVCNTMASLGRL